MSKVYKSGKFAWANGIAGNSVTVVDWDLVSKVWGFIVKAWAATWRIEWIALWGQTFASDNQTVAKAKLEYLKSDDYTEVEMAADDTITQADEWSYFNINNTTQTVDVATKSAVEWYVDTTAGAAFDAVIKYQVKLVKFVSQTKSIYAIVK